MRSISPRLCKDVVAVHATAFPDDAEAVPGLDDAAAPAVTVSGVCLQPIDLRARATTPEGDDDPSGPALGVSRTNVLFPSAPPAGIGLDALVEHLGVLVDGQLAAFAAPIAYRADGPAIPPSGGMTCWTVTATRRD